MSSRGRPPKNGTPFDRLLKKQCQKGKNTFDKQNDYLRNFELVKCQK